MNLDEEAWHGPLARALLDPREAGPASLHTSNGSAVSTRLAVYRNNVMASLINGLAETFPVVQALVGEAFFRTLAARFVRAAPPRSPVLCEYGAGFADFVASFEPAASVPYLRDVARLEWLRVRAYHAADASPVARSVFQNAAALGDALNGVTVRLHPSVHGFEAPWAAVSIWAAHQGSGMLEQVAVELPEYALVLRAPLEVLVLPTSEATVRFVQALQAMEPLGAAAAAAQAHDPDFALSAVLAQLLAWGAIHDLVT
ncbi:DNA-binding domain-containing protein [Roseateles sp. SL47]|uniref:HvfC/BufC N-terminal domain-containing protein n=1 Tax=Roseateles sp. SL47 TaxID=2995138 RepID=UPI00226F9805|nr:DNA-binding domain-containing protein [Roseateles sp. SL47]WAC73500.1 DNA-binding domain-containing protein [Roseateles sp. SL47]